MQSGIPCPVFEITMWAPREGTSQPRQSAKQNMIHAKEMAGASNPGISQTRLPTHVRSFQQEVQALVAASAWVPAVPR